MSRNVPYALLIILLLTRPASTQEWPQFRGTNVDGVASATDAFAESSLIGLDVAWKRPIGSGYSGLAIASGLLVTMFEAGSVNVLVAFDAETGAETWRFEVGERHPGIDGSYNGPISTPLISGNLIFGLGPWGRLVALDRLDGELVWSTDLVADHEAAQPNYGFSTSPLWIEGSLIVQTGGARGAVAAFEPESGELLWSAGSDTVDYQTPVPLRMDGGTRLLAAGRTELTSIDARSGRVLSQFAHGGRGVIGAQSMVPVLAGPDKLFLSYKGHASTGVSLLGEPLWESRTIRNSYAVPVFYDGYVYGFSSRFLTCLDPESGEAVWRSRPPGDGFPIVVDGHLVILTKDGSLHVAKATPEGYDERASVHVFDDLAWTPPAFAHGRLYVRSLGELARVDIRDRDMSAPVTDSATEGGDFERFVADVHASQDRSRRIDRFMDSQTSFPVIEGESRVHFIYRGPGEDLAIAGDMIGSRQERPMTRIEGTDFFYFSAELVRDARVNYRFVRDYEEIRDPLNPRETTTAIYREDMEINRGEGETEMSWLAMPRWEAPPHLREPSSDRPRGRLVSREVPSEVYEESHTVHVYLPAGYDDGEERYPVVYYHGGLGALRRGELESSLNNLLGRVATPLIAVFIERVGEWVPDRYSEMWAEELVPFIDEHYRTIPSPQARASVGGGDHGFTAAYVVFKKPGVAGKLASQSIGGLSFEDKKGGVERLVRSPSEQPLVVYMDWGLYDMQNPQEAWDRRSQEREFKQFLVRHGYDVRGDQVHDGTGWSSWKNRTDRVLGTLFPVE